MMLTTGRGNLLNADADALVNPVNTVGVSGKGLALQFKQAYPANFKAYSRACKQGRVTAGRMFVHDEGRIGPGRYVINFPTKRHWRSPSSIEDIEAGLADLVRVLEERDIESVAIPPLGCGNGGLEWSDVRPLIAQALERIPHVTAIVYPPEGAPAPEDMVVRTSRPKLNSNRAAMLELFRRYLLPDYQLTALEAQKLGYFLQVCGQPLRLDYIKGAYGPYAENLNHALQTLEGHYIKGYGDRTQRPQIRLLPGNEDDIENALDRDPQTRHRIERATRLIEGFETPYGLELLSTVHWAVVEAGNAEIGSVGRYVRDWSPRKGELFTDTHIRKALEHLRGRGLVSA